MPGIVYKPFRQQLLASLSLPAPQPQSARSLVVPYRHTSLTWSTLRRTMAAIFARQFEDAEKQLREIPNGRRPRTFSFEQGPHRYQIEHPDLPLTISRAVGILSDHAERAFGLSQSQAQEEFDQERQAQCLTKLSGTPVLGPTERAPEPGM